MESYSSSSSSSSMYSSQFQQAKKSLKLSNSFNSSLHSVRKSNLKPSKKPIAPLPPTPPRIYQVDPINFRDLVQKLTGAAIDGDDFIAEPIPQPHRLHRVAPPPLDIIERQPPAAGLANYSPVKTPFSALYREMMADTPDQKSTGFLELNLFSPSSWCSFPLLSPGTLSSLDQSTVL